MKLKNKIAVITGASRGLGAAIASEFAHQGAEIIIVYKDNKEAAEKIFDNIGNKGLLVQADLSDENMLLDATTKIKDTYPSIDILINNAGDIVRPQETWKGDISTWDKTLDTNLRSAWLMIRELAPSMNKGGAIINMSSVFGRLGAAGVLAYSVSKIGLDAVTRSMAKELAPNIRVNAIAPSVINTDMTKGAGKELISFFKDQTPMGRLGEPQEVAKLALFLASDDSSYITGQIIDIDGGFALK